MKKLLLSLALTIAIFSVGCSTDEDVTPVVNGGSSAPDTSNSNKDGTIASQSDEDLDPTCLQGDIKANITLTNDKEWVLCGPLSVKDGYTLTIAPGTTIKAIAGGTNVFIAVEQGAKINAAGTAQAPIRMTSAAGNKRYGDWGGLIINGKAPISGGGTSTTEVLPLPYGGTDSADNSGVLSYVVLEYTGARINGEKEFNGLTLYAVGSQTEVNNIVIYEGADDAIEFFGGSVSVENLLVVNALDDCFDWTQGYVGTANKNWYAVRTSDFTPISEDPRGIEGDGNLDGNSPSDANQSNPTIENVTIINDGTIEFADLVKIRRGSGANITGLYLGLGDDASASDTIDLSDSRGNAISSTSIIGTANAKVALADIKNEVSAAVMLTEGAAPSVDRTIFDWAGISF